MKNLKQSLIILSLIFPSFLMGSETHSDKSIKDIEKKYTHYQEELTKFCSFYIDNLNKPTDLVSCETCVDINNLDNPIKSLEKIKTSPIFNNCMEQTEKIEKQLMAKKENIELLDCRCTLFQNNTEKIKERCLNDNEKIQLSIPSLEDFKMDQKKREKDVKASILKSFKRAQKSIQKYHFLNGHFNLCDDEIKKWKKDSTSTQFNQLLKELKISFNDQEVIDLDSFLNAAKIPFSDEKKLRYKDKKNRWGKVYLEKNFDKKKCNLIFKPFISEKDVKRISKRIKDKDDPIYQCLINKKPTFKNFKIRFQLENLTNSISEMDSDIANKTKDELLTQKEEIQESREKIKSLQKRVRKRKASIEKDLSRSDNIYEKIDYLSQLRELNGQEDYLRGALEDVNELDSDVDEYISSYKNKEKKVFKKKMVKEIEEKKEKQNVKRVKLSRSVETNPTYSIPLTTPPKWGHYPKSTQRNSRPKEYISKNSTAHYSEEMLSSDDKKETKEDGKSKSSVRKGSVVTSKKLSRRDPNKKTSTGRAPASSSSTGRSPSSVSSPAPKAVVRFLFNSSDKPQEKVNSILTRVKDGELFAYIRPKKKKIQIYKKVNDKKIFIVEKDISDLKNLGLDLSNEVIEEIKQISFQNNQVFFQYENGSFKQRDIDKTTISGDIEKLFRP